MTIARAVHARLYMGSFGDALMELAASWTVVLVITGIFLWWPRGAFSLWGTLLPRLWVGGRVFWRDLHAVTGFWMMLLIGFHALTGIPRTGIAGNGLKQIAAHFNAGTPKGIWEKMSASTPPKGSAVAGRGNVETHHHHGSSPPMGWAESTFETPLSSPKNANAPTLDQIVTVALSKNLPLPFEVALPQGPTGVYIVSTFPDTFPDDPTKRHVLHIDRYSGEILADVKWSDYGIAGKVIDYGVSIHTGHFFGLANQLLM